MFTRVRWLKDQFFLMLDIGKLRSIQYQGADNMISNPTDLAAELPLLPPMVRKCWRAGISKDCSLQIQKAHMLCSLHNAHPPTLLCRFALDVIQTTRI